MAPGARHEEFSDIIGAVEVDVVGGIHPHHLPAEGTGALGRKAHGREAGGQALHIGGGNSVAGQAAKVQAIEVRLERLRRHVLKEPFAHPGHGEMPRRRHGHTHAAVVFDRQLPPLFRNFGRDEFTGAFSGEGKHGVEIHEPAQTGDGFCRILFPEVL